MFNTMVCHHDHGYRDAMWLRVIFPETHTIDIMAPCVLLLKAVENHDRIGVNPVQKVDELVDVEAGASIDRWEGLAHLRLEVNRSHGVEW
jgi:hypothetical protein